MSRRGFVLMAVLWLMVALSAVVLDLSLWMKTRMNANTTIIESVNAAEAADAGLQHALSVLAEQLRQAKPLIDRNPDERFNLWRAIQPIEGGAPLPHTYVAEFRDAASAINLNHAPESELLNFFTALGFAPAKTNKMTARIIAARPFSAEAEIAVLPGIESSDVAQILPHATTRGSGRVNVNTASVPVLAAVSGITLETARAIVQRRAATGPIASAFAVADDISEASRDSLFQSAAHITERLVAETSEVEVRSTGFNSAARPVIRATGLIERQSTTVLLTSRRYE